MTWKEFCEKVCTYERVCDRKSGGYAVRVLSILNANVYSKNYRHHEREISLEQINNLSKEEFLKFRAAGRKTWEFFRDFRIWLNADNVPDTTAHDTPAPGTGVHNSRFIECECRTRIAKGVFLQAYGRDYAESELDSPKNKVHRILLNKSEILTVREDEDGCMIDIRKGEIWKIIKPSYEELKKILMEEKDV